MTTDARKACEKYLDLVQSTLAEVELLQALCKEPGCLGADLHNTAALLLRLSSQLQVDSNALSGTARSVSGIYDLHRLAKKLPDDMAQRDARLQAVRAIASTANVVFQACSQVKREAGLSKDAAVKRAFKECHGAITALIEFAKDSSRDASELPRYVKAVVESMSQCIASLPETRLILKILRVAQHVLRSARSLSAQCEKVDAKQSPSQQQRQELQRSCQEAHALYSSLNDKVDAFFNQFVKTRAIAVEMADVRKTAREVEIASPRDKEGRRANGSSSSSKQSSGNSNDNSHSQGGHAVVGGERKNSRDGQEESRPRRGTGENGAGWVKASRPPATIDSGAASKRNVPASSAPALKLSAKPTTTTAEDGDEGDSRGAVNPPPPPQRPPRPQKSPSSTSASSRRGGWIKGGKSNSMGGSSGPLETIPAESEGEGPSPARKKGTGWRKKKKGAFGETVKRIAALGKTQSSSSVSSSNSNTNAAHNVDASPLPSPRGEDSGMDSENSGICSEGAETEAGGGGGEMQWKQVNSSEWKKFVSLDENEIVVNSFQGMAWQSDYPYSDALRIGVLYTTNAHLGFIHEAANHRKFDFTVPLQSISRVEKVGKRKGKGDRYFISIFCKDFRHFRFSIPKLTDQRAQIYTTLARTVFLDDHLSFFAYHRKRLEVEKEHDGWHLFDTKREFERQFGKLQNVGWRISAVNKDYTMSDTYPALLGVPVSIQDTVVQEAASFRSRGRIPALSYVHSNGASITRASQPMVGMKGHRSVADEKLVESIRLASGKENVELAVLDARPKVNAMANQAMGKGFESSKLYQYTRLKFLNIANIHVMRDSRRTLAELCSGKDSNFYRILAQSHWLDHIRKILSAARRVVELVHVNATPVLVHCSDGWDRTAQLTALPMLMLDPFFRTRVGFEILIEKEWLSFGHKFAQRHGHDTKGMDDAGDNERSPVFLQFLDCVWQLMQVAPCAFEFNELFLEHIVDALYSCHYGTFLFNCEKDRAQIGQVKERTESLWTYLNHVARQAQVYDNLYYDPRRENGVLRPEVSIATIRLWPYYLRYRTLKKKRRNTSNTKPRSIEQAYRELLLRLEGMEAKQRRSPRGDTNNNNNNNNP